MANVRNSCVTCPSLNFLARVIYRHHGRRQGSAKGAPFSLFPLTTTGFPPSRQNPVGAHVHHLSQLLEWAATWKKCLGNSKLAN